ncbi:hypothetical protein FA13DRAFT_1713675 [Coprinellus micaceus]|uniref:GATA-type domain-containing protein n=1 Tax=Coprinellus micaceus TaxID=71717 RepID=A0A4Y7SVC7_COPMI|nr:hypothetical protein FA13DRAFT_1713675 [Coprinellus micaceus]
MSPVVMESAPVNLHTATMGRMQQLSLDALPDPSLVQEDNSNYASTTTTGVLSPTRTPCVNCGTTDTPLWRRDAEGNPICNACAAGLRFRSMPTPATHTRNDTIASARVPKPLVPYPYRIPSRRSQPTRCRRAPPPSFRRCVWDLLWKLNLPGGGGWALLAEMVSFIRPFIHPEGVWGGCVECSGDDPGVCAVEV